jgi:hypothetical protein
MIEISDALREALASRPVLAKGQADNLVIEVRHMRVWLSRVDGTVTVERQKFGGTWLTLDEEDEVPAFRLALLETLGSEWIGGIW